MSIRLIHGADFHLDSPFEALDGDKAALRRSEQRGMLERICRTCADRGADMLLLSGDLFDSSYIYAETGEAFSDVLAGLGIPVFIAPGNHDPYSRHSPYARRSLPENVYVFRQPRLERVSLGDLRVNVWGAGYTSGVCPPLLRGFTARKQAGWLEILVLHAQVGGGESPYCPVTEDELAASGLDYAALGHVHSFGGLQTAGDCFYAWPGCPEGRGFDECGKKGVLQVDLSPGNCRAEFIPLGGREYRKLTVEAGEDPYTAIISALDEDTRRHIYKIILSGECVAAPDLQYLHQSLASRFFHLILTDETRPARDLWDKMREDTLTGAFLRRMRRRLDEAETDGERSLILEAVRLGVAALEGRELRI